MGFTDVVCYSNVANTGDLWAANIIFFHGVQNLWRHHRLSVFKNNNDNVEASP